jgi:hypothetical protein
VPSSVRCPTYGRQHDTSTANLTGITISEKYPRVGSNLKLGWPFSGDLESIDAVYIVRALLCADTILDESQNKSEQSSYIY